MDNSFFLIALGDRFDNGALSQHAANAIANLQLAGLDPTFAFHANRMIRLGSDRNTVEVKD